MVLDSLTREEIEQAFANLTVINFNYDRTVEQYLYWALQDYGQVSADVAGHAIARLDQIRPYGSIGKLPWQDNSATSYGAAPEAIDLFEMAKGIRTYTEQHEQTDTEENIDQALRAAHLVVFLGFGFHRQNMTLLRPRSDNRRNNIREVFGTVLGINQRNYATLQKQLHSALSLGPAPPPTLLGWSCHNLLSDLKPSIMAVAG
jgi:hypothetical protein